MSTPSDITDEQLIERVAVEVMGWEVIPHGEGYEQLPPVVKDHAGYVSTQWNPLTDWNHTMEVVEKINRVHAIKLKFWLDHGDTMHGLQRELCLAALKAVSPSA